MFEDRLRHRLKRWQQRHVRSASSPGAKQPPSAVGIGRIDPAHRWPSTLSAAQSGSQLERGVCVSRSEGDYLLLERLLTNVFSPAAELQRQWECGGSAHDGDHHTDDKHQAILAEFRTHFPQQAMFLDLETCGLAGAAIFLAGLIRFRDGQLVLTQLWARNYAEEAPLIAALGEIVHANCMLVSFNGKSFDWPQVRDRTTRYSAAADTLPELLHFDLLHHARRRYGSRFGDCRLQTLERHVLGRHRIGDIPGREIPGVYAEYVRSGDARLVEPILHHNALDLITLWQLALHFGR